MESLALDGTILRIGAEDAAEAAMALAAHRTRLIEILSTLATADAAADEVHRSIKALAGARWEFQIYRPQPVEQVSVFLPSNNVLYSYILFCIIPALYSRGVTFRPSSRSIETVRVLYHELAGILPRHLIEKIEFVPTSQQRFIRICANVDLAVYTGQYVNGLGVAAKLGPRTRVLLFGSGPNPVVVGPHADLPTASRAIARARLYNSGQDCLCPDVVFVHTSHADRFMEELTAILANVTVGKRTDPQTSVAPLVYDDAVDAAAVFLKEHEDKIVHGGSVNLALRLIEPTIVRLANNADFHPPEQFAPVFVVVPYTDQQYLKEWAESPTELLRGMYLSNFGEPALAGSRLGNAVVCHETTALDAEDGNRPFGGYGLAASSVHHYGRSWAEPLLISEQIAKLEREDR